MRLRRNILQEASKRRFIEPVWEELSEDPATVMSFINSDVSKFPSSEEIIKWVDSGAADKYLRSVDFNWQDFAEAENNYDGVPLYAVLIDLYLRYQASGGSRKTRKDLKKQDASRVFIDNPSKLKVVHEGEDNSKADMLILDSLESENFIFVAPMSWRACIFMDSFECGGQGAEWCIGYTKNDSYWKKYVNSHSYFILAFNKGNLYLDEDGKVGDNKLKWMIEIRENAPCGVWTQPDVEIGFDEQDFGVSYKQLKATFEKNVMDVEYYNEYNTANPTVENILKARNLKALLKSSEELTIQAAEYYKVAADKSIETLQENLQRILDATRGNTFSLSIEDFQYPNEDLYLDVTDHEASDNWMIIGRSCKFRKVSLQGLEDVHDAFINHCAVLYVNGENCTGKGASSITLKEYFDLDSEYKTCCREVCKREKIKVPAKDVLQEFSREIQELLGITKNDKVHCSYLDDLFLKLYKANLSPISTIIKSIITDQFSDEVFKSYVLDTLEEYEPLVLDMKVVEAILGGRLSFNDAIYYISAILQKLRDTKIQKRFIIENLCYNRDLDLDISQYGFDKYTVLEFVKCAFVKANIKEKVKDSVLFKDCDGLAIYTNGKNVTSRFIEYTISVKNFVKNHLNLENETPQFAEELIEKVCRYLQITPTEKVSMGNLDLYLRRYMTTRDENVLRSIEVFRESKRSKGCSKSRLQERTLTNDKVYYHGSPSGELKTGNIKTPEFFISEDFKYSVAYALHTRITLEGAEIDCTGTGYMYEVKLKKDLDIFDANVEEDLSMLQEVLEDLTSDEIRVMKTRDFKYLMGGNVHSDREAEIINAIKALGFDGYYNDEDVGGAAKNVRKLTTYADGSTGYDYYDDISYEAYGSGICLFDPSNAVIVSREEVHDFLYDHGRLEVEDCFSWFDPDL